MRILLLDNYDSFTYNLYDYLLQCGVDCFVLKNDAISLSDFEQLQMDAAVLSPGPQTPLEAGCLMDFIAYFKERLPILGVCLGHQALGMAYGAQLVRAAVPVHGKTSDIRHDGTGLFADLLNPMQVMRYHSLILEGAEQTDFQPIAWTNTGEVMACAHTQRPLWGVQFHPESILTPDGMRLLQNWLRLLNT
jgi:anthranilate synthase component II